MKEILVLFLEAIDRLDANGSLTDLRREIKNKLDELE